MKLIIQRRIEMEEKNLVVVQETLPVYIAKTIIETAGVIVVGIGVGLVAQTATGFVMNQIEKFRLTHKKIDE